MAVKEVVYRYRWVALGLAFFGHLGNALTSQTIAPLAPLLQSELGLSKVEVGLFASATFTGATCVLLIAGSFTDRYGIRKVMSIGQLLTGVLLVYMSTVGSFIHAIVVMFATGVGRGAVSPGMTKAVVEWFTPRARGTAMGIKQSGFPIAGVLTASTLPALALAVGWRAAFGLVGLLIVAGGIATAILYRDARNPGQSLQRKTSMRSSLGEVLRNRYIWNMSVVAILLVVVQQALVTYLALYFDEVVLVSHVPDRAARLVAAGGFLALCQMGGVFGRVFWGMVSDRIFHGQRLVVVAIVGALSALMSLLFAYLGLSYPLWLLAVIVFAYGVCAVGWGGLVMVLITEIVGRKYAGTGVGLSMTIVQIGNVAGPPLFGFVVDLSGSYQPAWLLMALFAVGGTLLAGLLTKGEKHVL